VKLNKTNYHCWSIPSNHRQWPPPKHHPQILETLHDHLTHRKSIGHLVVEDDQWANHQYGTTSTSYGKIIISVPYALSQFNICLPPSYTECHSHPKKLWPNIYEIFKYLGCIISILIFIFVYIFVIILFRDQCVLLHMEARVFFIHWFWVYHRRLNDLLQIKVRCT